MDVHKEAQLVAVTENHSINKCLLCSSDRTCSIERPWPTCRII